MVVCIGYCRSRRVQSITKLFRLVIVLVYNGGMEPIAEIKVYQLGEIMRV